jgi:hypothetical protein
VSAVCAIKARVDFYTKDVGKKNNNNHTLVDNLISLAKLFTAQLRISL